MDVSLSGKNHSSFIWSRKRPFHLVQHTTAVIVQQLPLVFFIYFLLYLKSNLENKLNILERIDSCMSKCLICRGYKIQILSFGPSTKEESFPDAGKHVILILNNQN